LCLSNGASSAQADESIRRAYQLFYGAGVLQNCHALTDAAAESFARAADVLALTPIQLDRARAGGLNRADWQYGNRGLGGYRRWCAGEGAAVAAWAVTLAQDPGAPAPLLDDGLTPR